MPALLFDFGGTLDADGEPWIERLRRIYAAHGIDLPDDLFRRAFYDADDHLQTRHRLRGLNLEETVVLQVQDALAAAAPRFLDRAPAVAADFCAQSRRHFVLLRPALERLGRSFRLAVVSNFYGNLDGILRAEGLRELFVSVADSGVLGAQKPDPALFLAAARAVECAPSDCVMVGDSAPRDVRGATAAGMRAALVCARAPAPEAGQTWTIPSVSALEAALERAPS